MNRSDFINLLEDKVQVNRQIIGEVYELIDIFPYFQSAHMVLLRGLQINSDVKFEKQLRISAIHIADREVLYNLLQRKPVYTEEKADIIPAVQESATEVIESDHQQTVIESAKNSEQMIDDIEKGSGELQPRLAEESELHHSHSILITSETESQESEEVMMMEDEEPGKDEEKIFYMDPGFSVPDYSDLLELDTETVRAPEEVHEETAREELTSRKEGGRKNLQADLIDKFILANPRIEPNRDPAKIPSVDISKPFEELEGGFVTETLARIYVNQGYYSRAIDIYEKLSLKYPEKSSYFASQIELVKVHLKK